MERIRQPQQAGNNGVKKRKQYDYLPIEADVALEFKTLSKEYRIIYSELMRRMMREYRKELQRNLFNW